MKRYKNWKKFWFSNQPYCPLFFFVIFTQMDCLLICRSRYFRIWVCFCGDNLIAKFSLVSMQLWSLASWKQWHCGFQRRGVGDTVKGTKVYCIFFFINISLVFKNRKFRDKLSVIFFNDSFSFEWLIREFMSLNNLFRGSRFK